MARRKPELPPVKYGEHMPWWPDGIPARVWARRILDRRAVLEDVPSEIRGLVSEHLRIAEERRQFEDRQQAKGWRVE